MFFLQWHHELYAVMFLELMRADKNNDGDMKNIWYELYETVFNMSLNITATTSMLPEACMLEMHCSLQKMLIQDFCALCAIYFLYSCIYWVY